MSGVGDYHYRDYDIGPTLPLDEHARWDDAGVESVPFDLCKSRDPSGKNLLVFHDACWTILRTCFHGAEIPLDRLAVAFRVGPEFYIRHKRAGSKYGDDPSTEIAARDVMRASGSPPDPSCRIAQEWNRNDRSSSSDIFAQIPMEIRHEIAQYLSGVDFYNARLASRSMGYLFFSQAFWRTRFGVDGDRGFLCCLNDANDKAQDWQQLYHCSNVSNRSNKLKDRKKTWERARWLRELCLLTAMSDASETSCYNLDEAKWNWKEVQALLQCDDDLPSSSELPYVNVLRKQTVYFSASIVAIHVSLIKQESTTYVTGLKLVSDDKSTSMGYALPGGWVMHEIKQFKGFEVALGERGIHALRIIVDGHSSPSSWIGSTHKACITNRLILQQNADALEASFDVSTITLYVLIYIDVVHQHYKMVTLAVGHKLFSVESRQPAKASWIDHMMKNALWYPMPPPRKLYFNHESFLGGDPLVPGYRPVAWGLFGGDDGSRLSSLTGITFVSDMDFIRRMSFKYAGEDSPTTNMGVGTPPWPRWGGYTVLPEHFRINGPGGERINRVQALVKECDRTTGRYFGRTEPLYYKVSWTPLM